MSDCPRHDGRVCAYDREAMRCPDLDCPEHQRAAEAAYDAAVAEVNRERWCPTCGRGYDGDGRRDCETCAAMFATYVPPESEPARLRQRVCVRCGEPLHVTWSDDDVCCDPCALREDGAPAYLCLGGYRCPYDLACAGGMAGEPAYTCDMADCPEVVSGRVEARR